MTKSDFLTKSEFLKLWAMPLDIKSREKRIARLQEIIDSAGTVTDTVQSSQDAGNATILCHAVVSGKADTSAERERLRRMRQGLEDKNNRLREDYPKAVDIIEGCSDPALRAAAHMRCLDGASWEDVAARLGFGSADSWRMAVSKFAEDATKKR